MLQIHKKHTRSISAIQITKQITKYLLLSKKLTQNSISQVELSPMPDKPSPVNGTQCAVKQIR